MDTNIVKNIAKGVLGGVGGGLTSASQTNKSTFADNMVKTGENVNKIIDNKKKESEKNAEH